MLPASIINNSTWRTAIHTAQCGENKALHYGFFLRKTTQPFDISDIKGVLGLAESPKRSFDKFVAILLLKDKRYAFIEAWKYHHSNEWGYGIVIYSRDIKKLLVSIDSQVIEVLKLRYYLPKG